MHTVYDVTWCSSDQRNKTLELSTFSQSMLVGGLGGFSGMDSIPAGGVVIFLLIVLPDPTSL